MNTTPIKKAAGGYHTTTATTSHNATDFIATGASKTSAGQAFYAFPDQRTDRLQYRVVGPRDTVHAGARHTTKQAGNLPDSEVFSRSEFESVLIFQRRDGYGAGSAYPQGRQHNLFCVSKPSSTLCPRQADGCFSVQQGTESMINVNTQPTPKTGNPSPLIRQQAIESALEDALHFIRTDHPGHSLCLATARTRRALSMLKQANAELSQAVRAQIGGAA